MTMTQLSVKNNNNKITLQCAGMIHHFDFWEVSWPTGKVPCLCSAVDSPNLSALPEHIVHALITTDLSVVKRLVER